MGFDRAIAAGRGRRADSGRPSMGEQDTGGGTKYVIHLDTRYAPLEKVDVPALVEACTDPWYNQTLCRVNDCVVRLGIFQGEFHWHKHDREDEFFYVVEGHFLIDLED